MMGLSPRTNEPSVHCYGGLFYWEGFVEKDAGLRRKGRGARGENERGFFKKRGYKKKAPAASVPQEPLFIIIY